MLITGDASIFSSEIEMNFLNQKKLRYLMLKNCRTERNDKTIASIVHDSFFYFRSSHPIMNNSLLDESITIGISQNLNARFSLAIIHKSR